jgi:hypothetical protein
VKFTNLLPIAVLACLVALSLSSTTAAQTIQVPITWCTVEGSPTEQAFDRNRVGMELRDRLQRAAATVLIPQADVTLRSAYGTQLRGKLGLPVIPDSVPQVGIVGDVVGDGTDQGAEFHALVKHCDALYAASGYPGTGLTFINVGRFVEESGVLAPVIGWTGCWRFRGICVRPYDGRIAVVDRYADLRLGRLANLDPSEIILAHAVGRALGLPLRNADRALMRWRAQQGEVGGEWENTELVDQEVEFLRAGAAFVPGASVQGSRANLPPDLLARRIHDPVEETGSLEAHNDLSEVTLGLTTIGGRSYHRDLPWSPIDLRIELNGPLDPNEPTTIWGFLDYRPGLGVGDRELLAIGAPRTGLEGIDMVFSARATHNDQFPDLIVFEADGTQELVKIVGPFAFLVSFEADLYNLPHPGEALNESPHPSERVAISQGIQLGFTTNTGFARSIDNNFPSKMRLQLTTVDDKLGVLDHLGDLATGVDVTVLRSEFGYCRAYGVLRPGGPVRLRAEGLNVDGPITVALGGNAVPVEKSVTGDGLALVSFSIPEGTPSGPGYFSIGVEGSSSTVECVLDIEPTKPPNVVVLVPGFRPITVNTNAKTPIESRELSVTEEIGSEPVPEDYIGTEVAAVPEKSDQTQEVFSLRRPPRWLKPVLQTTLALAIVGGLVWFIEQVVKRW